MFDYLPQEVLVEIFARLPINSIVKCTAVCKSWYSLIASPTFISSHLNKQDAYLLVLHCSEDSEDRVTGCYNYLKPTKAIYSLYYDNENFDNYVQLEDMPFKWSDIVGCCNGVFCLARMYYLWNPSIKKSMKLPEPIFKFQKVGPFDHTHGFGFDPVTSDYKLVRIVHTRNSLDRLPPLVELYKLSTGIWQDITHVSPCYKFYENIKGVYVNGACHWVAAKYNRREFDSMMVVLFDMQDETFWEMMIPDSLVKKYWFDSIYFNLFESDESLCLCDYLVGDNERIDIWKMKEYGDSESWVKQFSISLSAVTFDVTVVDELFLEFDGGRREYAHFLHRPIYSRKNGEILWRSEDGLLVSYDMAVEKIKYLGICDPLYVSTYKMSLNLLGKGINDYAGDTCESNLCKRGPKGGRNVLTGNSKRGLRIVSPLRIRLLMYKLKMEAKRWSMILRKNR